MTTLILLRHGEVEGITPPIFRGHSDLPLTARGVRQSELTRDALHARHSVTTVYCSPLERCMRTAEIVSTGFGIAPVPYPGLDDIHYGEWTGLSADQVWERWPRDVALWKAAPHMVRFPGGESLQDVAARAVDALTTILSAHSGGTLVLVTHDSVLRVLFCHMFSLPLSSYWLFAPEPCGISVLDCSELRFTARSINEIQHLLAT